MLTILAAEICRFGKALALVDLIVERIGCRGLVRGFEANREAERSLAVGGIPDEIATKRAVGSRGMREPLGVGAAIDGFFAVS